VEQRTEDFGARWRIVDHPCVSRGTKSRCCAFEACPLSKVVPRGTLGRKPYARLVGYSEPDAFHVKQKTRYSLFESAVRATVVPRGTAERRFLTALVVLFGRPRVSRGTKGALQHFRGLFPNRMSFHVEQWSLRWFSRIRGPCVSRETKGVLQHFRGLVSNRLSFHVEHLGSTTCEKEKSPLRAIVVSSSRLDFLCVTDSSDTETSSDPRDKSAFHVKHLA
jgi:hypothetical protein